MYRSYSYNDMPKPIPYKKPSNSSSREREDKCVEEKKEKKENSGFDLFGLQTDDIILLIIILALIINDCEDKLLIAALGFILLSELL